MDVCAGVSENHTSALELSEEKAASFEREQASRVCSIILALFHPSSRRPT